MSRPTYDDERWLRSELDGLLAHEPAMSGAVRDDVARGLRARARRRRRAAVSSTLVALVVAVAVPLGLTMRPFAARPAPSATAAGTESVRDVLAGLGLEVVSAEVALEGSDGGRVTTYSVQRAGSPGVTYRMVTAELPPSNEGFGDIPTGCGAGACSPLQSRLFDCADPDRCPSVFWADLTSPSGGWPTGTLVMALRYASGALVEGTFTPADCPACSVADETPMLTVGQARSLLLLLGAPEPLSPTPEPTPSAPTPSAPTPSQRAGVSFVPESQMGASIAALLPGTVTSIEAPQQSTLGVSRGFRVVRDGVGTFVRVLAIAYTDGSPVIAPPASGPPCAASTPSCTVLRPWSAAPSGTGAAAGVWSVIERTGAGSGSPSAYAGPFTVRTVVLQRGSTELVIDADSRDISPSGDWISSSAPGLSVDELLALASRIPLPERYGAAVETPWRATGSASADVSGALG